MCVIVAGLVFGLNVGQEVAAAASAEHGKTAFIQSGCWPDPLPWETFSAFVRSSNRAMPPFSEKILSDNDLADIYAYLQSIPKPPDTASIPLLKE
jgi:hypothetical protein